MDAFKPSALLAPVEQELDLAEGTAEGEGEPRARARAARAAVRRSARGLRRAPACAARRAARGGDHPCRRGDRRRASGRRDVRGGRLRARRGEERRRDRQHDRIHCSERLRDTLEAFENPAQQLGDWVDSILAKVEPLADDGSLAAALTALDAAIDGVRAQALGEPPRRGPDPGARHAGRARRDRAADRGRPGVSQARHARADGAPGLPGEGGDRGGGQPLRPARPGLRRAVSRDRRLSQRPPGRARPRSPRRSSTGTSATTRPAAPSRSSPRPSPCRPSSPARVREHLDAALRAAARSGVLGHTADRGDARRDGPPGRARDGGRERASWPRSSPGRTR